MESTLVKYFFLQPTRCTSIDLGVSAIGRNLADSVVTLLLAAKDERTFYRLLQDGQAIQQRIEK